MVLYLYHIITAFITFQSVVCSFIFLKVGNHRKLVLKCVPQNTSARNASWKKNSPPSQNLGAPFGDSAHHHVLFVNIQNFYQYKGSEKSRRFNLDLTWFNPKNANLVDQKTLLLPNTHGTRVGQKVFSMCCFEKSLTWHLPQVRNNKKIQGGNQLCKWWHKFDKLEINLTTWFLFPFCPTC